MLNVKLMVLKLKCISDSTHCDSDSVVLEGGGLRIRISDKVLRRADAVDPRASL